jgi:hypothetical protein
MCLRTSFPLFFSLLSSLYLFLELNEMNLSFCPCGLTREELTANKLVGPGGICTAVHADESLNDDGTPKICNRPLGAHPQTPRGQNL